LNCFWSVHFSLRENEEKANTIQPPFLCFSHLQHIVGVVNSSNGPGHPKRGPVGQESDDYKRWHLESKDSFILAYIFDSLLSHLRVFLELLIGSSVEYLIYCNSCLHTWTWCFVVIHEEISISAKQDIWRFVKSLKRWRMKIQEVS